MKIDTETEQNKKKLRKKIIGLRDGVSAKQRARDSEIITHKLLENKHYRAAYYVLIFYSFGSEIDTRPIINNSITLGKKVILPRVMGNMIETFFVNDPDSELERSSFGVMEPIISKCTRATLGKIDFALIPGVCFDKEFNRLGYGGGFYDQLIPKLDNTVLRVAPCFNMQLVDKIPVAAHDKKVDIIITEKKTLKRLRVSNG